MNRERISIFLLQFFPNGIKTHTFFIYGFLIIRNKFLHNFSNITGITDLFCQNHLHGTDTRMIQSYTVSLPINNLYSVKILSVQHMRNLL